MRTEKYRPVPFNIHATRRQWMKNPAFKRAYAALEDEFATLDALLEARRHSGLTQAEVAGKMGIKQSALARIESSLANRKHAPSLTTLRKYAAVLGCKLELRITPNKIIRSGSKNRY